jgi:hypothetical protein
MKKVFLTAALALAIAGSWAFYPKAPAEPSGYMMLKSQLVVMGFGGKVVFSVYPVEGPVEYQEVPVKIGSRDKALEAVETLRVTELKKLNEYRKLGWHLVEVMQSGTETIYVLEMP